MLVAQGASGHTTVCLTFLVQTAAWPGIWLLTDPRLSQFISRGFFFSAFVNCASASKSLVVTFTYVVPGRLMMSNLHTLVCELYSVIFFCCIGELAQYMRLARLLFLLSFCVLSFSPSPFPSFFFLLLFFPLSLILFSFS